MAITYAFPTTAEVRTVGPLKVARMSEQRLGLQILPVRSVNQAAIEWVQKDNFYGLQQLRGLGGAPSYVKPVGNKKYRYEPGYYGEYMAIEEAEMTLKAGSVINGAVDMSVDVMSLQDQLIQRELDRIEYIIWKLLVDGTFNITGPNGSKFTDTFSIDTYSASDWSDYSNGKPLYDFRDMQAAKSPGKGNNFGAGAMAVMNRVTYNYLFSNANSNDLGGKLVFGGNSANVIPSDISKIMLAQDAPSIYVYDEGYYDDSNTFQRYVPTDKVVVIGKPTSGEIIGEYLMTRHMIDGGGVGSWEFVKDYVNGVNAPKEVPSRYEIHRGHSGGPVLYRPGAVVVMSV